MIQPRISVTAERNLQLIETSQSDTSVCSLCQQVTRREKYISDGQNITFFSLFVHATTDQTHLSK